MDPERERKRIKFEIGMKTFVKTNSFFRFVSIPRDKTVRGCSHNVQCMRLSDRHFSIFLPDPDSQKKVEQCVKCAVKLVLLLSLPLLLVIDEMFMFSSNFDGYDVVVCRVNVVIFWKGAELLHSATLAIDLFNKHVRIKLLCEFDCFIGNSAKNHKKSCQQICQ